MGMSLINQPGTFEYDHRQISEKITHLKQEVDNYLNTLRTSPTLPDNATKELAKYEVLKNNTEEFFRVKMLTTFSFSSGRAREAYHLM
jgi:hypothetical protein